MLSVPVALVTGGSRGIGRAICLRLAKEGFAVAVNYTRQQDAAESVAKEIEAGGGSAMALQGDVAQDGVAEQLVKSCVEAYGRLDVLVNNAGIIRDQVILRMGVEAFDEVVAVDLKGPFLMTKAALRPMLKARHGRIINMASAAALTGNPGQANYASAKAGLIGLTKSIAKEVGSRNITVNAVAPGLVETDMTATMADKAKDTILGLVPLGRVGGVEDVAAAVAFLAGPGAAYITGEVLRVDGGLAM